jgi:ankyrin repeat protein
MYTNSSVCFLTLLLPFDALHLHEHAQAGWTALIFAAANGHVDCARLLIDAGADKNAKNQVCLFFDSIRCCLCACS